VYPGERFNSISHLVGAALALAAAVVLIVKAAISGDALKIVSFSIYGFTLFMLYLISTLYHSLKGQAKSVFKILDHQAIYLLIAGTYTPFMLVTLRGSIGWWMCGVIWGLAITGIILEAVRRKGRRILSIVIYLVMGWMVVITLDPLLASFPINGFYWLLAGGIFYTVGIIFFILGHWNQQAHGVWHLFVVAGSVSHYFSILHYV
jgi:hemolysin III